MWQMRPENWARTSLGLHQSGQGRTGAGYIGSFLGFKFCSNLQLKLRCVNGVRYQDFVRVGHENLNWCSGDKTQLRARGSSGKTQPPAPGVDFGFDSELPAEAALGSAPEGGKGVGQGGEGRGRC